MAVYATHYYPSKVMEITSNTRTPFPVLRFIAEQKEEEKEKGSASSVVIYQSSGNDTEGGWVGILVDK